MSIKSVRISDIEPFSKSANQRKKLDRNLNTFSFYRDTKQYIENTLINKDAIFLGHTNHHSIENTSNDGMLIIRTEYTKRILKLINWLAENHTSIQENEEAVLVSFNHITQILSIIKEYIDKHFDDPFCSYLIAIYDALTNNNTWKSIDKMSFSKLAKSLKLLNNKSNLEEKEVLKYIFKLEEMGLNPLPY